MEKNMLVIFSYYSIHSFLHSVSNTKVLCIRRIKNEKVKDRAFEKIEIISHNNYVLCFFNATLQKIWNYSQFLNQK